MAYRTMDRPTFEDSDRLSASFPNLPFFYSAQKSRRVNAFGGRATSWIFFGF